MTSVSLLCFLCDCKLALTVEMLSDHDVLYAILMHVCYQLSFLEIVKG